MSTFEVGPRRLHVITWGCQMNVYDSGRMADVLAPLGYAPWPVPRWRRHGDPQYLPYPRQGGGEGVFRTRPAAPVEGAKAANGGRMILAVAGCVAQAEGAEILARAPSVDIVLGPQTYHRLPEMIARAARAGGAVLETDFPPEDKFDFLPDAAAPQGITAFLTIQEGCDTLLQLLRGALHARRRGQPPGGGDHRRGAAIWWRKARARSRCWARTSMPGTARRADGGTWGLGRLLRELASLPEIQRMRYTTSHPRDMDDELIAAHRDLPVADAVPAPAGAVGLRPGAGRDEPPAHGRRLSPAGGQAARRAARHRPVVGFHCRPSRAKPNAISKRRLALVRAGRLRPGVLLQILAATRHAAAAGVASTGAGSRQGAPACRASGAAAPTSRRSSTAAASGKVLPVLFTGPGRHPGQIAGRSPFLQPVHVTGPQNLIGQRIAGADRRCTA